MFKFTKTEIEGVLLIDTHVFEDGRGVYNKTYEKYIYEENGIKAVFTETSDLYSAKGALRGLHYQDEESQAKLVHVIRGAVFDVALDLRTGSPTFGRYHTQLLTEDDDIAVFIPEGFAHGFIGLTDRTIFSYQSSGRYRPDSAGGIIWNDPELAIPWPLEEYGVTEVIATDKDRKLPTLAEYIKSRQQ